jgi:acetate---CoA ligase (ADP-forming)
LSETTELPRSARELSALFAPDSIALVGVSQREGNLGRRTLRHLQAHGYAGRISIVHPSAREIGGLPVHRSIAELGEIPDLAVVCTHGDLALDLLDELVDAGVPALMVLASSGAVVDSPERVRATLARSGARLLGPNSPGYVSAAPPIAPHISHFLTQNERLRDAPIGLIAQSGAVAGILANRLLEMRVGFRWAICTGNEHDLGLGEALAFVAAEDMRAIGLFVETVRDLEHFRHGLELAAERGVRVCAVKVGESAAGRRQALTHTGALTGMSELFEQELLMRGGHLCRDLEELAACLAVATLPRPRVRSLAVAATSGGVAGLLGDRAAAAGIEVPELEGLPNPWDTDAIVMEDPEGCAARWREMLASETVGAGLLGFGAQPAALMHRIVDALVAEPIAEPYVLVPAAGMPAAALEPLAGRAVAIADTADAVAALAWWSADAAPPPRGDLSDSGFETSSEPISEIDLDELRAKRLIAAIGIAVPRGAEVRDAGEAAAFAATGDGPYVLKCLLPAFAHKAAVGAVRLGVGPGAGAIERAWDELAAAVASASGKPVAAVLIEEQVEPGIELLVSVGFDERHGAYLTLGAGGSGVEQLADVAHRLLPISVREVERALSGLSLGAALRVAARLRGEDGAAPAQLVELVLRLARLAEERPGITVEINPVILPLSFAPPIAVDCLIVGTRE